MTPPRFSIVTLMIAVGAIALNLAVARFLFVANPELLLGSALIGLAVQVALFRLVRGRARWRLFSVGFAVAGFVAMVTVLGAFASPGEDLVSPIGFYYKDEEPLVYSLMYEYRDLAQESVYRPVLLSLNLDPAVSGEADLIRASYSSFSAIIWFLPQVMFALAGGLLATLGGKGWNWWRGRDPRTKAERLPAVAVS